MNWNRRVFKRVLVTTCIAVSLTVFCFETLADPPKIASLLACPKDTEMPRKGFCCRKDSQNGVLQKAYGVDAHCVFHGPIVYGDLNQSRYSIINYEYGRLMGPRWEIIDHLVASMQEYDDSAPVGSYQQFDRKGQVFLEGTMDHDQVVGTWRAHIAAEKRTYAITMGQPTSPSPIQICGLKKDNCTDAPLISVDEIQQQKPKIERIEGFYQAHGPQFPDLFDTLITAFLPLRVGPGAESRLVGIVVQNRLVTSWNSFHPFTYLDRDLGYVPVAQRSDGTCLVQMLPTPLPWVWIPCRNSLLDLAATITNYKWSAPSNPTSIQLSPGSETGADLHEIRELIATGTLSLKPNRVFEHENKQWVEATLTDFAKDLNWEILTEELELRKKLNSKAHAGKKVFFPLIYDNTFNFLPLDHN